MEFSIKNEINSFHLFCNNSTVVKNKLLPHSSRSMEGAQCDGAAFGGSDGLRPGTVSMSFADVLSFRQRPGPSVSVGAHVLQNEHLTAAVMQTGGVNADGEGREGSSMESTMLPAHGVELYRMHPAQPLSDSSNNEEGGGSWNVSSGSLVCAVDREEFDSRLLDSLVVPSAEFELHGPLTQLMTPPPREALAGDKDEFGWLMQSTDTTSCDLRTDSLPVNDHVNRQLFYTRLQQVQGKEPKDIRNQVDQIFIHHFPHHPGFHYPHSSGGVLQFQCSSHTSEPDSVQVCPLYIRFHKRKKVHFVWGSH